MASAPFRQPRHATGFVGRWLTANDFRGQAELCHQGWRIVHAEGDEQDRLTVAFQVDDEPITLVGRIDRIDFHEASRTVRILDYKTADSAVTPEKSHYSGDRWTDLQLPLYRHLWRTAVPLPADCAVEVAYCNLSKSEDDAGIAVASWDDGMFAAADEETRRVVRLVRNEVFWPPVDPAPKYRAAADTEIRHENDPGKHTRLHPGDRRVRAGFRQRAARKIAPPCCRHSDPCRKGDPGRWRYSPPRQPLHTLWSHTAGFDDWDTDALVIKLSQRSLLELTTLADGKAISLHDLVYDYVRRAVGDETALHQRLLEAYRKKCPNGWHANPPNDGYYFTHLRHHLIAAGRAGELADLLVELRWLEAKNEAGLTFDLPADFDAAMKALPETDGRQRNLRLLVEAMRRDIHFIARHAEGYPQGLFQCLWNSCWWFDTPDAMEHYDLSRRTGTGPLPWDLPVKQRLSALLERWRAERERQTPRFNWVRSHRPPAVRLGAGQIGVFPGHVNFVNCVSYCEDGNYFASGTSIGIRVWNAETGVEIHALSADSDCLAYRGDGKRIACAGSSTLTVWDAETGQKTMSVMQPYHGYVTSVAYSPDGKCIVGGSQTAVQVWDADTGKEVLSLRGHSDRVTSASYRADGARIVSASYDRTVRVWDSAAGLELHSLCGHSNFVTCAAFSPDGHRIVSGSWDRTVRIWDANTGQQLHCIHGHDDLVTSVAFHPDGNRVVSGSHDKTVRVWNADNGDELRLFHGHRCEVSSVAFRHDGIRIVSGSYDRTVRVWSTDAVHEHLHLRGHRRVVNALVYRCDGALIVSGCYDGSVCVWDAHSGHLLCSVPAGGMSVNDVAFSRAGDLFMAGSGGRCHIWDSETWQPVAFEGRLRRSDWRGSRSFDVLAPTDTYQYTVVGGEIRDSRSRQPIAWFPVEDQRASGQSPINSEWAVGDFGGYVGIFSLEGCPATQEKPK